MYKRSLGDGVVKINETNVTYLYSVKLLDFNKNQSEILVPIQWVKQNDLSNRKLDFNYESTYTYDYSEYNDMFTHSVSVNPHDYTEKGLLIEPFASKVTLQYMLCLLYTSPSPRDRG